MGLSPILKLYTEHHRRSVEIANFRREYVPPVIRYINTTAPHSFINYTDLTAALLADTIEREVLYFKALGHDFEWKVYNYDQPPDLLDRLAASGFEIGEEEALLVLDTHALPPKLAAPNDAPVREVTDPDAITETLRIVQGEVFGRPGWVNDTLATHKRTEPDTLAFFAAYADGGPVSAAWTTYTGAEGNPFAGLYGGATLPAYRGQGYYTALVGVRARHALARGVRYLHVDASPMSRPILEKIGFTYLASSWEANYTVNA